MSSFIAPKPGLAPNGWYQLWRQSVPSDPALFTELPGFLQQGWIDLARKANEMIALKERRIQVLRARIGELEAERKAKGASPAATDPAPACKED